MFTSNSPAVPTRTIAAFLLTGLVGCGSPPTPDDVARSAVTGTVRLDGQRLDNVDIIFESEPIGETGQRRAVHTTVRDGKYAFDEQDGPAVGKATVRFLKLPESREQVEAELNQQANRRRRPAKQSYPIPEKYAAGSTLQVQIDAGELNKHDFELETP